MSRSIAWKRHQPPVWEHAAYNFAPDVADWITDNEITTLCRDDLDYLRGRADSCRTRSAWHDLIEAIEAHGVIDVQVHP